MDTDKFEIVIVYNRLNLVMKLVSKIIGASLNLESYLIPQSEIESNYSIYRPQLLIIDQSLTENNNPEIIEDCIRKFPESKILIITLEESWKLNQDTAKLNDIGVLNLWHLTPSLSKVLIFAVQNKLNH